MNLNIQLFDKPLLARPGQFLLEKHLERVMEDGYNLILKSSIKGDEILYKAGLFFHDVGKSEITIQRAFYNKKNPPISHTHLSFIFFYSWLKDFLKKENQVEFQSCFLPTESYKCSYLMKGIFQVSFRNKEGVITTYCGATPPEVENIMEVSIAILENPSFETTEDFVKRCKDYPSGCISYIKTINEQKGIDVRIEGIGGNLPTIYIPRGDKTYQISMAYSCDMDAKVSNEIFNQMLSTFRFLE